MSTEGHPRFSEEEMQRRHKAARTIMEEMGIDALLIFGHSGNRRHYQADVHYFSELALFHECYLLLPLKGDPVIWTTHNNHYPNAREHTRIPDIRRASRRPGAGTVVAQELKKRGFDKSRIGMVGDFFYREVDKIRDNLPDMAMVDATGRIKRLRMRKSSEEIAYQRIAAKGCDAVMETLRREIRPGIEERDILIMSENAAWDAGCAPTFLYLNSTQMADSDSCVPNQLWSRRKIRSGDVINTELTVNYAMYCSQILRPFFVGDPTAEYARIYEVMKNAYDSLCACVRAGTTLGELYEVSLQIRDAGFTTVDGISHGFGVDIQPPSGLPHDFMPPLDPEEVIEDGTTLVIQPNPTTKDFTAGMQLGDMGLVTAAGFENMHSFPAEVTRL